MYEDYQIVKNKTDEHYRVWNRAEMCT